MEIGTEDDDGWPDAAAAPLPADDPLAARDYGWAPDASDPEPDPAAERPRPAGAGPAHGRPASTPPAGGRAAVLAGSTNPPTVVRRRPDGAPASVAITVAAVLSVIGAVIDANNIGSLRATFAFLFVGGCTLAALAVRRRTMLPVLMMPPLVYLLAALVAGPIEMPSGSGSFLSKEVVEVASELVINAPILILAVLVTVGAAFLRLVVRQGRLAAQRAQRSPRAPRSARVVRPRGAVGPAPRRQPPPRRTVGPAVPGTARSHRGTPASARGVPPRTGVPRRTPGPGYGAGGRPSGSSAGGRADDGYRRGRPGADPDEDEF